jgi:hypothetical protein
MRCGIDQYGAIIHDRVAILGDAILPRHLVIGHAARRQVRADANLTFVTIRRNMMFRHVAAKARPAIVGYAAGDGADAGAYGRADRGPPTIAPVTAPVVAPAAAPSCANAAIGNESAAAIVTTASDLVFMICSNPY